MGFTACKIGVEINIGRRKASIKSKRLRRTAFPSPATSEAAAAANADALIHNQEDKIKIEARQSLVRPKKPSGRASKTSACFLDVKSKRSREVSVAR